MGSRGDARLAGAHSNHAICHSGPVPPGPACPRVLLAHLQQSVLGRTGRPCTRHPTRARRREEPVRAVRAGVSPITKTLTFLFYLRFMFFSFPTPMDMRQLNTHKHT